MRRLEREEGNVVVAVMIVTLMLALGMAAFATVGTQTRESRVERVRESAFNLTEGALNAQAFIIGRLGPGSIARQYPVSCPAVPASALCPDPASIGTSFDGTQQADYGGGQTTWATSVRDNGSGDFYDAAVVDSQPTLDANGDNQVWVRSTATVHGETRTVVALVKVEARQIEFPRHAISAGHFSTSNNGNKVIVDSTGSLGLAVRCSTPAPSASCLDYPPDKGQVTPPSNVFLGYASATAISADDLQGLEELADANGTHYTGCPSNPNGTVVVIDAGDCAYNNSAPAAAGASRCCNTATAPGILIIKNGTVAINGNIEFHGIVYGVNQQATTGNVVSIGGTAIIRGGVTVDGAGGVATGASGGNLVFAPRAFDQARSFGTASIVQNTWRELRP